MRNNCQTIVIQTCVFDRHFLEDEQSEPVISRKTTDSVCSQWWHSSFQTKIQILLKLALTPCFCQLSNKNFLGGDINKYDFCFLHCITKCVNIWNMCIPVFSKWSQMGRRPTQSKRYTNIFSQEGMKSSLTSFEVSNYSKLFQNYFLLSFGAVSEKNIQLYEKAIQVLLFSFFLFFPCFIEVWLTNKSCIYLGYTAWCLDTDVTLWNDYPNQAN